ncbi:MAG TPA: phosphatidate cytidylyltransferase [Candidatus Acidoferrales bacterium]|nr:phosphatidate cytidylyltransferase [Candidatus Acidoferrales bacterium]
MFWKRAVTAAVLIPAVIAMVLLGPLWLVAGAAGAVVLLALLEFFRLGDRAGLVGFVPWTTLCSLIVVYAQWTATVATSEASKGTALDFPATTPGGLEAVLVLFILGLGVAASLSRRQASQLLSGVTVSAGGLLLVALPLSYLVRLAGFGDGRRWLLLVLVMIWVGDTAAYLVGKAAGRIPMAPTLSPKKTWEGAAANLLAALGVGIVAARWLPAARLFILELAVLVNIAGQAGDLLESAYKRSAGVKDSGQLLPGHGGMLDRVDSLVLAVPMAWWYLWWLGHTGHLG